MRRCVLVVCLQARYTGVVAAYKPSIATVPGYLRDHLPPMASAQPISSCKIGTFCVPTNLASVPSLQQQLLSDSPRDLDVPNSAVVVKSWLQNYKFRWSSYIDHLLSDHSKLQWY